MDVQKEEIVTGSRIYFLDNMRTSMIFLVVLYHAGVVYESSGFFAPFWIVDDDSTNIVVGIVNILLDIVIMPTIFFVSGFFAPLSVRNKTGWTFLTLRFKRLVIPWLFAVLTLIPLYKVIFLYARQLPQEHWTSYFHFSNGIIGQSWLWFLPVLFLFDVVYWLLAKAKIRVPNISLTLGVVVVFVIGVLYSIGMSRLGGQGWTKTILIDFQNERLLIYFMMFLIGSLCFKLKVFESLPKSKRFYIAVNCTAWIPINVYFYLLINFLLRPGTYYVSAGVDGFVLACAYHLSVLSLLYVLVATFWFYRNKQSALGRVLNANSYNVYIVHLVVMGGIALAMLNTGIPSLWKYLILTVCTYAASNVIVYAYRELLKPKLIVLRLHSTKS